MQEHENVEKAPNLHISKGWYGVGKKGKIIRKWTSLKR